jgi:hypothetical protein
MLWLSRFVRRIAIVRWVGHVELAADGHIRVRLSTVKEKGENQ